MKKFISTTILTVLMISAAIAGRQDYPEEYLGLPGDNLNLYAVMKLFQDSETLEAFERELNDENSRINNLDLNNDGYVDYITVSDYVNGEDHTIVLRSVLDRNESQDVAVFTVEKLRNGEFRIQLIGDEALYGRNYIVEPIYAETPNPGYKGRTVNRDNVTVVTTTYYEIAAWPMIRYIYSPRYVIWRSNWYWGYYPVYYRPWRPFYWHAYYGYHYHWYPHYYSCYRHWHQPRYHYYHDYYYKSVRAYSPNVSHRITAGTYKQTYSRPESRRDGEALYASTSANRSRGSAPAAASGSDRRSSAATGSRSAGSPAAVQNGETRRASGSPAAAQGGESRRATTSVPNKGEARPASTDRRNESTPAATQGSTNRRVSTGTVKSTPASGERSSSTPASAGRSNSRQSGTAAQTQSRTHSSGTTVQRSSQPPAGRSQSTVQRSSQSSGSRSQATVQRSSQSSRGSQQPAVSSRQSSGSRQAVSQKSSSSSSQRSSAPSARSQSKSSSQGKSSAPSQGRSSSRSSSSSKGSDDNRSSRR